MGAHLSAYTTREHTAYYIKALSQDLPKGSASGWRAERALQRCRDWHQEPLAWLQNGAALECGLATGQPGARPGAVWCCGLQWPTRAHTCPSPAVELLADVVQNCSLEDSQIEKERDVILRELQESDASLRDVVFDYLHATAFQGTPLAQPVEGPSDNVRWEPAGPVADVPPPVAWLPACAACASSAPVCSAGTRPLLQDVSCPDSPREGGCGPRLWASVLWWESPQGQLALLTEASEPVLRSGVSWARQGLPSGPQRGGGQGWGRDRAVRSRLLGCSSAPFCVTRVPGGGGAEPWPCVLQEAVSCRPDGVPRPALQGPAHGAGGGGR